MESNIVLNKKQIELDSNKNAKTLAAVHTHTHTHTMYCLLVNKKYKIRKKYNNKDRTVLKVDNAVLSLLFFMPKGTGLFRNIFLKLMDLYIKVKIES